MLLFKNKRIIILIENSSSRDSIREMLKKFRSQTVVAKSFESYLGMLATAEKNESQFDGALVDYQVIRSHVDEFNSNPISKKLKTALLLNSLSEKEEDMVSEISPDLTINKPVTPSALLDSMMRLFNQEKSQSFPQRIVRFDGRKQLKALGQKLGNCEILIVEDNRNKSGSRKGNSYTVFDQS